MIYKLVVNVAFLAIGYYIGKEVCRSENIRKDLRQPVKTATTFTTEAATHETKKTGT